MTFVELFTPALFGEVLKEAPAPVRELEAIEEVTPARAALNAQASLLRAGFTPGQALAGALQVLADERPRIANASGKARPAARKKCNWLRSVAAQIALEEMG